MRHLARTLLLAACLVLGMALPTWAGSLCGTVRNRQTSAVMAHAGIFLRTPAGACTGIYGATVTLTSANCITGFGGNGGPGGAGGIGEIPGHTGSSGASIQHIP